MAEESSLGPACLPEVGRNGIVLTSISPEAINTVPGCKLWFLNHLPEMQDELSGADIKAACTEAGLLALRERRMRVTHADFKKAKEKIMYKKKEGVPEGLYM